MPTVVTGSEGAFRVEGQEGYLIYAGVDAIKPLDVTPTFSTSLPAAVTVSPPGVGTKTVNVVVRRRDIYGLESQNSLPSSFIIDSAGTLQLPTLPMPVDLKVYLRPDGKLKVIANYPGHRTDSYRADKWRVWVGPTPPDPDVDTPTVLTSSPVLNHVTLTARPPGLTSYVAVALYRTEDATRSAVVTASVLVPADPDAPEAV